MTKHNWKTGDDIKSFLAKLSNAPAPVSLTARYAGHGKKFTLTTDDFKPSVNGISIYGPDAGWDVMMWFIMDDSVGWELEFETMAEWWSEDLQPGNMAIWKYAGQWEAFEIPEGDDARIGGWREAMDNNADRITDFEVKR